MATIEMSALILLIVNSLVQGASNAFGIWLVTKTVIHQFEKNRRKKNDRRSKS